MGGGAASLAHLGSPPKQKHSVVTLNMHADLDGAIALLEAELQYEGSDYM